MRFLLHSRPWRSLLLLAGAASVIALSSCMDREPAGPDPSGDPVFTDIVGQDCQAPGPWKFVFRSNQQISAVGLTAFILNPLTGRRVTADVNANHEAVFTFRAEDGQDGLCVGDRVIGGLDNLLYQRLQQQLQNGKAFYAPFDGVEYSPNPSPEPRIISLYYTAVGSNNWIAKTVGNLEAILQNAGHASWFTLTLSGGTSQPISVLPANFTSLSGEVRITRILDTNGQTVNAQGNLYGLSQIITSGSAANIPCDPHVQGTARFVAWFCSLPTTLFSMETVVGRTTRVPPGSYVVAVKLPGHPTGKKTGIRAGNVGPGGTDEGDMLAVNSVRFSYDFAQGSSQLRYARSGFEGDESVLTGAIQAYWNQAAAGTIRVTFVENPATKPRTTEVTLECGTARAPNSCVQVSSGKIYPHFGVFNQTKGEGSGVVSIPQHSQTTEACVRITLNGTAAQPLFSDPTWCPNGNFMKVEHGRGGTFRLM